MGRLSVLLMLITAAHHFKGVQILTDLSGEKLKNAPLNEKVMSLLRCEIVSVTVNLDENLCIQGQRREARIPQILAYY